MTSILYNYIIHLQVNVGSTHLIWEVYNGQHPYPFGQSSTPRCYKGIHKILHLHFESRVRESYLFMCTMYLNNLYHFDMSIGCYSDMIQDLHCKLESNRLANQIFPKALSTRRIKTNNAKASRMSITNVKQGCRWRVRRLLLQLFLIQTYLAIPQVYFSLNCFIIHCKQ